ncbi:MAG TPA: hypothetical protein V6C85_26000 [Allocoleopsis sp.]
MKADCLPIGLTTTPQQYPQVIALIQALAGYKWLIGQKLDSQL